MQPHSGRLERGEVKAELRGFGCRRWWRFEVETCGENYVVDLWILISYSFKAI